MITRDKSTALVRTADPTPMQRGARMAIPAIFARALLTGLVFALMPALTAPAAPIMVVIDLHADPMPGNEVVQEQIFQDWVDNTNWLLDITEPRGAKLSFLSTGQPCRAGPTRGDFRHYVVRRAGNLPAFLSQLAAENTMTLRCTCGSTPPSR